MVSVIIDHAHARRASAQLEAPVDAAELVKSSADRVDAHVEADTHGNRSCSVQHVVHAGDMQRELSQILFAISYAEPIQRVPHPCRILYDRVGTLICTNR